MNPKYQSTYEEWHNEVSASTDANGSKDSLGGCWTPYTTGSYCPRLVEWLCSVFPIKSVIDLGCGTGETLRSFRKYGIQVLGIEGLKAACKYTDVITINHNIEAAPIVAYNVDLVFSLEFVEHIVPEKVDNVIDTLCNGKMIVMSAAQPEQGGHHHTNCQHQEYWVDLITKKGYRYLEELSAIARTLDQTYFSSTGMIFLRNDVDWGTFMGNYKERSEAIKVKETGETNDRK